MTHHGLSPTLALFLLVTRTLASGRRAGSHRSAAR
jgi:hypothetical protein